MDEKTCMAHFRVSDLSKVTVNIVMNTKKQVERRDEDYTCGNLRKGLKGETLCKAIPLNEFQLKRCIDVPLTQCPFKPVSIKTGKELKQRYVE